MLVRLACLGGLAALVIGCSSAPQSGAPEPVASSASAITTTDVLSRADQWVTAKLLYCQSANHQPDYDTSCSSVCNRENNTLWDPYRSDCSGFVSWAWGLPAPGRVTGEFAPFDTTVSHTIQGIDLEPGDALNLSAGGHIILFVQWITKGSEAQFYEEPGCSSSTPYAHSFNSAVTINGSSLSVAWFGEAFTAIRFDSISPPDQPPTGSLDTATCSDITGSAVDPDSPTTPLEIDLDFDAPDGKPGSDTLSQVAASFSFPMPLGLKDNTQHTVYAYAKDAQTSILQLLTSAPKTFTCAPPPLPSGIKRHVPSTAVMTAWKFDALLDVAKEPLAAVQALPSGPDLPAAPTVVISDDGSPEVWVIDGTARRHVVSPASLTAWKFAATTWTAAKVNAVAQGLDWPATPFVTQGVGAPEVYVLDALSQSSPGTDGGTNPTNNNEQNGSTGGGCNAAGVSDFGFGWVGALALMRFWRRRK
jgi:hypothetical protein